MIEVRSHGIWASSAVVYIATKGAYDKDDKRLWRGDGTKQIVPRKKDQFHVAYVDTEKSCMGGYDISRCP